jgi:hypothetical protein
LVIDRSDVVIIDVLVIIDDFCSVEVIGCSVEKDFHRLTLLNLCSSWWKWWFIWKNKYIIILLN